MTDLVSKDLTEELMQSDNPDEITRLINMFNLNIRKKDVIRANTLSNLQDKITEEMSDRIEYRSGEFSNQDLLSYMSTIHNIVSKTNTQPEVPQIAIQNNTTVNVTQPKEVMELDRASKDRVKDVLAQILGATDNSTIANVVDAEIISEDD